MKLLFIWNDACGKPFPMLENINSNLSFRQLKIQAYFQLL